MFIYGVGAAFLLVLLLRPSWGLLGFFCLVAAVFCFRGVMRSDDLINAALIAAPQLAAFCGSGALIVWLRGAKREGKTPSEREIDAELARIRAETASREGPTPPPAQ